MLDAVDRIKAGFDLIQFPGVKAIGIQPVSQIGGKIPGAVVQLVQPLGHGSKRFIEPGTVLQSVHSTAQKIRCARLLAVLIPGQCKVGGGDALQNALSMGDDRFALLQGLFLAGLQRSGVNGIDLGGQGFYAALLVGLAGVCGIQLALYRDQLAVAAVILGKQLAVLGVLIQQIQMQGRVCQALAVVLAVDGKKSGGNIPHHGSGGRHTVDTAAALALGVDLTVQKQVIAGLITALLKLLFDGCRYSLKGGPDTRLLSAAAHKLAGGTVTKNGVDGVDQDGLTGTCLTCQHRKAMGEVDLGLFNNRNIFNFQVCQHGAAPPCRSNYPRRVYCCSCLQMTAASSSLRIRIKKVSSPERVPTTLSHCLASNTSQAALAMPEKHLTSTICPA